MLLQWMGGDITKLCYSSMKTLAGRARSEGRAGGEKEGADFGQMPSGKILILFVVQVI